MTRPDLDAIRARASGTAASPHRQGRRDVPRNEDALTLLAYIDELECDLLNERATFESCNRARQHCEYECATLKARTACIIGEDEWSHRIATLEHMLGEERENVDTLRARVAELEAEVAILRPWSVMLKRAHGALTDAGCVVPLEFDQSIEHAINDLARRATRAEQLFVDEYDARKAAEREISELKARITTLEAMRP